MIQHMETRLKNQSFLPDFAILLNNFIRFRRNLVLTMTVDPEIRFASLKISRELAGWLQDKSNSEHTCCILISIG